PMELTNEFRVAAPVEQAWAVLTDVERIAPCLPGAQLQEIEGDEYRGLVKVKVGPITAQYKGKATFVEKDDPAHRAVPRAGGGAESESRAENQSGAESQSESGPGPVRARGPGHGHRGRGGAVHAVFQRLGHRAHSAQDRLRARRPGQPARRGRGFGGQAGR